MGIIQSLLYAINLIKEMLDFIKHEVEHSKREKEKKNLNDLKKKIEEDVKKGDLSSINDKNQF